MRERILKLDLDGVVEWFSGARHKLFEVDEEKGVVRVEYRLGPDEAYVVKLKFKTEEEKNPIVDRLRGQGFVEQERVITAEW